MNLRVKRLKRWLKRKGGGAFLVLCEENRRYLSGFSAPDVSIVEVSGALLVTERHAFVLTDPRYIHEAREAEDFEPFIYRKGLSAGVAELVRALGVTRLFYEENYLSCGRLKILKKLLSDVELSGTSGVIERMREVKDEEELELMRKAMALAEEVFAAIEVREGRSEKEISWQIVELCHRLGEGPAFPPIVASGPNAAKPHAQPEDRVLRRGEAVVVDLGVKYKGYCSDLTRTYFLGRPPERLRQALELVRRAKDLARPFYRPGTPVKKADEAVRNLFKREGVLENYLHSLGHGLGLAVHEAPAVSYRSRKKFKESQVVTLEPGLYFEGLGGVREEEMVFVGQVP